MDREAIEKIRIEMFETARRFYCKGNPAIKERALEINRRYQQREERERPVSSSGPRAANSPCTDEQILGLYYLRVFEQWWD